MVTAALLLLGCNFSLFSCTAPTLRERAIWAAAGVVSFGLMGVL